MRWWALRCQAEKLRHHGRALLTVHPTLPPDPKTKSLVEEACGPCVRLSPVCPSSWRTAQSILETEAEDVKW